MCKYYAYDILLIQFNSWFLSYTYFIIFQLCLPTNLQQCYPTEPIFSNKCGEQRTYPANSTPNLRVAKHIPGDLAQTGASPLLWKTPWRRRCWSPKAGPALECVWQANLLLKICTLRIFISSVDGRKNCANVASEYSYIRYANRNGFISMKNCIHK